MTPEQHATRIRQLEFALEKAEHGLAMPYSREDVAHYRRLLAEARAAEPVEAYRLYYEAENINDELNKMNETELASAHAQRLMDRLEEIRAVEVQS